MESTQLTSFDSELTGGGDLTKVWGPEGRPLVSVIIAGYNDSHNIRAAIDSALDQTLHATEVIVVDDCSSDDTYEVVTAAVDGEPRARAFRLDENSGGAGAPRNLGLSQAQAPYAMFLDSDDLLERHACFNLLRAAEESGADLCMGRTGRYEVKSKRHFGWHAKLYREPLVVDSIEDDPELSIDTNSVAKLYRREFLKNNDIHFPVGRHYEDLVFTAQVFALARGISVIPEKVYQWNVYPVRRRRSITNQRNDIQNLKDRKSAIAEVIRISGVGSTPLLHRRLQLKIVRHDVRLYLNDIADGKSRVITDEILTELRPLIESVPFEVMNELPLAERLLIASAHAGEVDLIKRLVAVARGGYDLYGDWSDGGDESRWEPDIFAHCPAGSLERRLTTFDAREVIGIPWYSFECLNEVRSVEIDARNVLTIRGVTHDSFGKFRPEGVGARLVFKERWGLKRTWATSLDIGHSSRGLVEWSATWPFPSDVDLAIRPKISVRLELSDGSTTVLRPLRVKKGFPGHRIMVKPVRLLERLANIRYQPYSTVAETLALRVAKVGNRRRKLRNRLTPLLERGRMRLEHRYVPLDEHVRGDEGARIMRAEGGPPESSLVFVESQMGRSQFDSPRIVADTLASVRPDLKVIWSAAQDSAWSAGRDDVVVRHTPEYYRTLARAGYIIDNQGLPDGFVKRAGQIYLQTWHGIPLKRMGLDEDGIKYAPQSERKNLVRKAQYWDFLTCPSEYYARTFVRAFDCTGELLPLGTPRNDELVRGDVSVAESKRRLGLDPNRASVLYAPTFRQRGRTSLQLDVEALADNLGNDVQLLLRPHYLNRIRVPSRLRSTIIDLSGADDTSMVLLAADLLVTDYSSIMFDYLCLDRPIILYAYDADEYMATRGTYFDPCEDAPGRVVSEEISLASAITEALAEPGADRQQRQRFRDRYAGAEPGDSALKTVQRVWGER